MHSFKAFKISSSSSQGTLKSDKFLSNSDAKNSNTDILSKSKSSNLFKGPVKPHHQNSQSMQVYNVSSLVNGPTSLGKSKNQDDGNMDIKINTKNQFFSQAMKKPQSLTPDKKDFSKQSNINYNSRSSINAFDAFLNTKNNNLSDYNAGKPLYISHAPSKSMNASSSLLQGNFFNNSSSSSSNMIINVRDKNELQLAKTNRKEQIPMKNPQADSYLSSYKNPRNESSHEANFLQNRSDPFEEPANFNQSSMKKSQSEIRLPKIDQDRGTSAQKKANEQQQQQQDGYTKSINNININLSINNLNIIQNQRMGYQAGTSENNNPNFNEPGNTNSNFRPSKPKTKSYDRFENKSNTDAYNASSNNLNSRNGPKPDYTSMTPNQQLGNIQPTNSPLLSKLGGFGKERVESGHKKYMSPSVKSEEKKSGKFKEGKGVISSPSGLNGDSSQLSNLENKIIYNFAFKSKAGSLPNKPVKTNQDAYIVYPNFAGSKNKFIFGICDGHGLNGHVVSNFVKQNLPKNLEYNFKSKNYSEDNLTVRSAMHAAFMTTNKELLDSPVDCNFSGSTTVITQIFGTHLWCGNVGDSRAIVCKLKNNEWTAVPLSNDHKPDEKTEMQRILASGGRVEPFRDINGDPVGPHRVWLKNENVPGLAMARSMGDSVAAQVGVISEPEIFDFELVEEDRFIVIASDGVWEFLSNQQVMNFVVPFFMKNQLESACDKLIREATACWKQEDEVVDDITCVIIALRVPSKQTNDIANGSGSVGN